MIEFLSTQSELERLQYIVAARADADPYSDTIGIYVYRDRSNASATLVMQKLNDALNCLTKKNGKGGAAIVVNLPEVSAPEGNAPGPLLRVTIPVDVIENPLFNMGTDGTGKTAESIVLWVLRLFNQFTPGSSACQFFIDRQAVTPQAVEGKVYYRVLLACDLPLSALDKVPAPQLVLDGDGNVAATRRLVTAAIYVTTDGSHPYAANPSAQLYAAPFAVGAGTEVRAVAYLAGFAASDVATLST